MYYYVIWEHHHCSVILSNESKVIDLHKKFHKACVMFVKKGRVQISPCPTSCSAPFSAKSSRSSVVDRLSHDPEGARSILHSIITLLLLCFGIWSLGGCWYPKTSPVMGVLTRLSFAPETYFQFGVFSSLPCWRATLGICRFSQLSSGVGLSSCWLQWRWRCFSGTCVSVTPSEQLFLWMWNVKWNLFWIKMTSSTITKSSKVNNTRAPGSKSKNSSSNPSQALIFCFFKIFSYWWHLGKSHLLTLSVLIYILGYNSERLCPLYACHESISASNFGRRKQRWSKVTSAVFLIISWSGWG